MKYCLTDIRLLLTCHRKYNTFILDYLYERGS